MTWHIFIHPIWMLIALYLGIRNLAIGFNKSESWTFPIRSHRQVGFAYTIMVATGAFIGWYVNSILFVRGNAIRISGHNLLMIIILSLAGLIIISGLIRQKHTYRLRWLQGLHPWFGVLAVGLMFAQLFLGLLTFLS
jgi:hypothetical protein